MFVANTRDGACDSYYTNNMQFDHSFGRLLYRLSLKNLDALKYFGLCDLPVIWALIRS